MIRTTDTGGVKMIYNGEPVNDQCLNTRDTHIGYNGRSSQTLNSSYYYGTDYVYDSTNQVFSLAGTLTQATWNGTTGYCSVDIGSSSFTVSSSVAGNYSFSYNSGILGVSRNGSTVTVWQTGSSGSYTASTTLTVNFTPNDSNYATSSTTVNVIIVYSTSGCVPNYDWVWPCSESNSTHCNRWDVSFTDGTSKAGWITCDP